MRRKAVVLSIAASLMMSSLAYITWQAVQTTERQRASFALHSDLLLMAGQLKRDCNELLWLERSTRDAIDERARSSLKERTDKIVESMRVQLNRHLLSLPAGEDRLAIEALVASLQRHIGLIRSQPAQPSQPARPAQRGPSEALESTARQNPDRELSVLIDQIDRLAIAQAGTAQSVQDANSERLLVALGVALFGALALILGGTVVHALRANAHLAQRIDRLEFVDPLTELPNRRAWDERLPAEFIHATRSGAPLSAALITLGKLPSGDDSGARAESERALREVGRLWRASLRRGDFAVRYASERFAVLLNHCDAAQAHAMIERFRPRFPPTVDFCAGVATWDGRESAGQLIARLERALGDACAQGQNCTVVLSSSAPASPSGR